MILHILHHDGTVEERRTSVGCALTASTVLKAVIEPKDVPTTEAEYKMFDDWMHFVLFHGLHRALLQVAVEGVDDSIAEIKRMKKVPCPAPTK